MKSWWYYFSSHLSSAEVQYVKDYAKGIPAQQGTVGHGGGKSIVRKSTRNSVVKWIKRDPQIQWLFDRISLSVMRANSECFNFDLPNEPYLNYDSLQFTTYSSKGEQHYDWHTDNNWLTNWPDTHDRKISLVVQMTDPSQYEGGQLELDGLTIPEDKFRNVGDMILFPSFLKHRVTPVTKGTRQSLVTWITGPRFR